MISYGKLAEAKELIIQVEADLDRAEGFEDENSAIGKTLRHNLSKLNKVLDLLECVFF
jgi:hypothetical protein